jgi:hypothetical protein
MMKLLGLALIGLTLLLSKIRTRTRRYEGQKALAAVVAAMCPSLLARERF